MNRLTDPGAGMAKEQAREARMKEWKEPADPIEAARERAERICAGMEDELKHSDPAVRERARKILDHFKPIREAKKEVRDDGDNLPKQGNR